jgi:hydroxymethylglutaryl-CoA reductase (NADPH)
MEVPAFLLRRLYVRGSLRNENGGFAFDLMNALGSGYAERVLPISVDGEEVPVEAAAFTVDGETVRFSEVSADRPMTLGLNKTVTLIVDGKTLSDGKHNISVGFVVTGMGEMRFDVTDAVGDEVGGGDAD